MSRRGNGACGALARVMASGELTDDVTRGRGGALVTVTLPLIYFLPPSVDHK